MRKPFIAGNWKMFKTLEESLDFAREFKKEIEASDVVIAIAAPFINLKSLIDELKGTGIKVLAQNMHYEDEGAFTGEVSAKMLCSIGVDGVVIGHSERRSYFNETDETVNLKLKKALSFNLLPIVCVGESLKTREEGLEKSFVGNQIEKAFDGISKEDAKRVVIAYEPIWAIGTGKTASKDEAQDMCCFIREKLCLLYGSEISEEIIIQYGGSVNANNASELLSCDDIDGALVGGASLKVSSFLDIVRF